MSRFLVTGHKRETKKWPKSQITQQKYLRGLANGTNRPKNSASYMSASKKSTRVLRPQSEKYKYAVGFNMSWCNISVK